MSFKFKTQATRSTIPALNFGEHRLHRIRAERT
jgi:hypothetical protein